MDGSDDHDFNNSAMVQITGKVMVVAIIVLFMVVVFVLFLHLYAKWFWWRVEQPPEPSAHRRRRRSRSRFVFAPGQDPASTLRTGLDPAVLRSIPVIVVNPEDFKEGLECAVCLSELVQGEKARLLPKCNHGFHVECIDMWFQSHSTCPLCRNPVDVQQGSNSLSVELESAEVIDIQDSHDNLVSVYSTESPNFPTNVLFWGNETQVSTGGTCLDEGPSSSSSNSGRPAEIVVIDIEEGVVEEEEKSPLPPTRLRSFKRLLSREKKVNPTTSSSNNCSGSSCDDEQIRR